MWKIMSNALLQYDLVLKRDNIKLIMYGENGEVEYGGDMKYANSPLKKMTHKTLMDHRYKLQQVLECKIHALQKSMFN